ncbi:general secretion pathway protein GspB [Halioxenophilus sp. WMMB6]|uniref:general secretion pathway protein GspB n=1 Tax=Halioxenophilus sp. WMMB6 TaxID=3073815 RepID=UPI00295E5C78|nr:general secretion pathway protein GspB [Halioxenophilus sp. WMMB6]
MSYILEALQKSEQDRQQQDTPTLGNQYDAQPLALPKRNHQGWWLVALLGVVLLVLLVWLWQSSSSAAPPPQASPATITQPEPGPTSVEPAAKPAPSQPPATAPPVEAAPTIAPVADSSNPPATKAAPRTSDPRIEQLYQNSQANETVWQASPAAETPPAPTGEPAAPVTLTPPAAVTAAPVAMEPEAAPIRRRNSDEEGFIEVQALPDTIKSEIIPIRYIAHVYADSQLQGFVVMNDMKLSPGDRLAPELYLEKVAPDYAILSFRGYFFKLNAMQSWAGYGTD